MESLKGSDETTGEEKPTCEIDNDETQENVEPSKCGVIENKHEEENCVDENQAGVDKLNTDDNKIKLPISHQKRKRRKRRRKKNAQESINETEITQDVSDNGVINKMETQDLENKPDQFNHASEKDAKMHVMHESNNDDKNERDIISSDSKIQTEGGKEKDAGFVIKETINKENNCNYRNEDKATVTNSNIKDIFSVQSNNQGSDSVPTDKKNIKLRQTDETVKTRKKKKPLLEIKKRSSKVAIRYDDPLPPIQIQPFQRLSTPPRTISFDEKPETTVNIPEVPQLDHGRVKQKKQEKHKSPLWICNLFYRFPVTSFVIVTLCHLAVIGTTVGLFVSGYDVFPIVFEDLPLYIHNDVRQKELSWRERSQVDGFVYRFVYGYNIATGVRSQLKDTVEVIFEKDGGNLLNRHDLLMIKQAEDTLFYNRRFLAYFCLWSYSRSCVKPQSILRLFDGTYSNVDAVFNDRNFTDITTVIYKASLYNETRDFLYLFLGKGSHISPDYVSTSITRMFFFMGWPLGRMENFKYGTFNDLQSFLVHDFKSEIEHIRDHKLEGLMDVFYLSKVMLEYDLVQQALKDILLAIGSISFIFVFMCFQTGSLTITFFGILSIVSSFLWTNLIYRYVFQYIYFGFFHVIALFLILGIGADDLFVFYDTWRLTGHNSYPSDAHRLSDCYRRAAKTTFVTSCTTMVAFLASGLSPLLPVRTFGIFAGVLVGINYLWVIIYFPVIILLHHLKIKHMWHKCHSMLLSIWYDTSQPTEIERNNSECSVTSSTATISETNSHRALIGNESKHSIDNDKTTLNSGTDLTMKTPNEIIPSEQAPKTKGKRKRKTNYVNDNLSIALRDSQLSGGEHDVKETPTVELNLNQIQEDAKRDEIINRKLNKPHKNFEDRNRIVKFLKNGFFDFMTLRVVKFVIPLVFIGVSIFFIVSATGIEPDTHQLRLFRSTHNYAKASDRHYFSFIRNHEDEYQRLYLVWGLEEADISYCNLKSGSFCHGKTVPDYGFSMESGEAQLAMKDLCNSFKNFDPDLADRLRIRRDSSTNELQIACFTDDFDKYFEQESQTTFWGANMKYPVDMNLSLPVTAGNVSKFMSANSQLYHSQLSGDFNRYFQILISSWMTDGYSLRATSDFFKYNTVLGEHRVDGTKGAYYTSSSLYYGTRTLYVAVEINTTMDVYSLNYKDGMPIFREWETFMAKINSAMPGPLRKGFQLTENLWHWIYVQETLVNSAVIGILIGLFSAWPILVLTTLNFVIGTIAAVTIALVTCCVVGMIPLVGWKLGVLESINLGMVVGLSVDYVVHLAEAYRMSEKTRRLDRVRSMLESIGLSVISGAITTIGAAVFMLFAQIQFFFQFGIFIISTVGISLLFSLFCFTTFMSLVGPQGDTGSLKGLCSCICNSCCTTRGGKDSDNNESDDTEGCCSSSKCVSPLTLKERIFDWLSYKEDKQHKPKVIV